MYIGYNDTYYLIKGLCEENEDLYLYIENEDVKFMSTLLLYISSEVVKLVRIEIPP